MPPAVPSDFFRSADNNYSTSGDESPEQIFNKSFSLLDNPSMSSEASRNNKRTSSSSDLLSDDLVKALENLLPRTPAKSSESKDSTISGSSSEAYPLLSTISSPISGSDKSSKESTEDVVRLSAASPWKPRKTYRNVDLHTTTSTPLTSSSKSTSPTPSRPKSPRPGKHRTRIAPSKPKDQIARSRSPTNRSRSRSPGKYHQKLLKSPKSGSNNGTATNETDDDGFTLLSPSASNSFRPRSQSPGKYRGRRPKSPRGRAPKLDDAFSQNVDDGLLFSLVPPSRARSPSPGKSHSSNGVLSSPSDDTAATPAWMKQMSEERFAGTPPPSSHSRSVCTDIFPSIPQSPSKTDSRSLPPMPSPGPRKGRRRRKEPHNSGSDDTASSNRRSIRSVSPVIDIVKRSKSKDPPADLSPQSYDGEAKKLSKSPRPKRRASLGKKSPRPMRARSQDRFVTDTPVGTPLEVPATARPKSPRPGRNGKSSSGKPSRSKSQDGFPDEFLDLDKLLATADFSHRPKSPRPNMPRAKSQDGLDESIKVDSSGSNHRRSRTGNKQHRNTVPASPAGSRKPAICRESRSPAPNRKPLDGRETPTPPMPSGHASGRRTSRMIASRGEENDSNKSLQASSHSVTRRQQRLMARAATPEPIEDVNHSSFTLGDTFAPSLIDEADQPGPKNNQAWERRRLRLQGEVPTPDSPKAGGKKELSVQERQKQAQQRRETQVAEQRRRSLNGSRHGAQPQCPRSAGPKTRRTVKARSTDSMDLMIGMLSP